MVQGRRSGSVWGHGRIMADTHDDNNCSWPAHWSFCVGMMLRGERGRPVESGVAASARASPSPRIRSPNMGSYR